MLLQTSIYSSILKITASKLQEMLYLSHDIKNALNRIFGMIPPLLRNVIMNVITNLTKSVNH